MSERLPSHESAHEAHLPHEQHETKAAHEVNHAELARQQKEQLSSSRESAEKHAAPSRLLAIEKEDHNKGHDIATHHAIKKESYKSLLKHTRQSLPPITRQFSKLIHAKNVETLSNIGSRTVARPSGLFGGGLGALIGSITLLYYSKHYGFRYNYAFFLVTFLIGFLIGLVVESIYKLAFKRR